MSEWEALKKWAEKYFCKNFLVFGEEKEGQWEATLMEPEEQTYCVRSENPFLCFCLDKCYEPMFSKIFEKSGKAHVNKKCDYILFTAHDFVFIELKNKHIKKAKEQLYISKYHWDYITCLIEKTLPEKEDFCKQFPNKYQYCILTNKEGEIGPNTTSPIGTDFSKTFNPKTHSYKGITITELTKEPCYQIEKMR